MFQFFLILFSLSLFSQSDNDCTELIARTIKPRVNDASAVCLHEKKKKISKSAKASVKRISKLKKKAERRRKRDIAQQKQDGKKKSSLFDNSLSTEAFNQNILIQIASECNHFNSQLSKALIRMRKRSPQCQKDLMYDVYLSSWRLNNKVLKSFIDKRIVVKKEGGSDKLVDPELESYQQVLKGFGEFEGATPVYLKDPYASYPANKRKPAKANGKPQPKSGTTRTPSSGGY